MRTVSATEAKNRLGALIGEVADGKGEVIVEHHGRPKAVLISYEAYRDFVVARDQQRRRETLNALRRLREEVLSRNQDLNEDAADQLIEEISADVRAQASNRLRTQLAKRTG